MASIKFYLKRPKDKQQTSIYFMLNYGAFQIVNGRKKYLPLKYYTSETIDPKYWNLKDGRVRANLREAPEFNARLQYIKNQAFDTLRSLQNENRPFTNDILREELDKVFNKNNDQTGKIYELIQFIEHFIETSDRAVGTKKSYNRVLKDLLEYQEAHKVKLTFDSIDIDFHATFIHFLRSKLYSPNTIGTRIKILKTFMNEAYDRELHNNLDYKKKSFSKPSEESVAIYLNDSELLELYNLDLTKSKRLDQIRDWFLIAAYTGLRFSDLSRITNKNIQDGALHIKTQKTDTIVAIPIHSIVRSIFNKYMIDQEDTTEKQTFQLPKIATNQKFNEYIKEVCKLANISEPVRIEQTKGTMKTIQSMPKHELVSAHTARRSFATNAYLAGVPSIQIMLMTGHRTEKSFLKYIKISEKENAKKLQLHPFFTQMIVSK